VSADVKTTGLMLLRQPFPAHQISKLPKPKDRNSPKGRCLECGGWHGLPAVHLDYVGHAALTDRLLDADPAWTWEPLAMSPDGVPVLDSFGGMWIKLHVLGVTRLGYGHAGDKQGGDAIKEIIGDALRNAAMRFGAALDLWHKGDLHLDAEDDIAEKLRESIRIEQDKKAAKVPAGVMGAVKAETPALPQETRTYLDELSADLRALFDDKGQAAAFDRLEVEGLDADQKIYLWALLPSKMRGALKIERGLRIGAA
jgi:hypothetical protein